MVKIITKKTKRRLCFLVFAAFLLLSTILVNVGRIWLQIIDKIQEEKFLKEEIVRLQREENHLRSEVQKLQDPDYIARYAREKYLYSRDGEFTIRIP